MAYIIPLIFPHNNDPEGKVGLIHPQNHQLNLYFLLPSGGGMVFGAILGGEKQVQGQCGVMEP